MRRQKKQSDYAVRLAEKQKAKYIYGLLEKQFRRTFETAKREQGETGTNLFVLLERRLDNTVYRLGFANACAGSPARLPWPFRSQWPQNRYSVLHGQARRQNLGASESQNRLF